MFSQAWQALLCWTVLLAANGLTLAPFFYGTQVPKPLLKTLGWMALLIGNIIPLGAVFFTAVQAGRTDEGLLLAVGFGVIFLVRCSIELGKITQAVSLNKSPY